MKISLSLVLLFILSSSGIEAQVKKSMENRENLG